MRSAAGGPGSAAGGPRLEAVSPRYGEKLIQGLLALCALISVATTTAIIISLIIPTIGFFASVPASDFFFGTKWAPAFADASFGVLPIVVGTLTVTFWALLIAIPVGLLSAIYLAEYAPVRVRKTIKPVLEVLEGIPTVAQHARVRKLWRMGNVRHHIRQGRM